MSAGDDEPPAIDLEPIFTKFMVGVTTETSPSNVIAHFDLAMAFAEMGLLREAMNELAMVLRADPAHLPARTKMLVLRLRLTDPDGEAPDAIAR